LSEIPANFAGISAMPVSVDFITNTAQGDNQLSFTESLSTVDKFVMLAEITCLPICLT
jgi:hypothetical protein